MGVPLGSQGFLSKPASTSNNWQNRILNPSIKHINDIVEMFSAAYSFTKSLSGPVFNSFTFYNVNHSRNCNLCIVRTVRSKRSVTDASPDAFLVIMSAL